MVAVKEGVRVAVLVLNSLLAVGLYGSSCLSSPRLSVKYQRGSSGTIRSRAHAS